MSDGNTRTYINMSQQNGVNLIKLSTNFYLTELRYVVTQLVILYHAGLSLQVRIEHGADDTVTTSPWTAEVEHSTTSCNGVESVQLVATLTGWPSLSGYLIL